ncbi:MAG: succinate dehydrogenase/fumarate reductase cytochrome b subunit [Bacteroidales bacterium]|nr:succinate dehydrogenase/fumarate reductase cytochrome b subunit [Bacteroidales bacterium]
MKGFFKSSIGKKLIMSVTGCFLILFLTFHMCMNFVAIISAEGYNKVCEFLGTNWYALVGTAILALGFVFHIVYASVLTIQNRKARGNDRYDNQNLPAGVEWSSKNMFILGAIVLLGLGLHFCQFWAKMMFAELAGCEDAVPAGFATEGWTNAATDGAAWIKYYFSNWVIVLIYLVWFAALWLHLNHGFWSMFQTVGFSNDKWLPRLKTISTVYTTILMLGFAAVVIAGFIQGSGC